MGLFCPLPAAPQLLATLPLGDLLACRNVNYVALNLSSFCLLFAASQLLATLPLGERPPLLAGAALLSPVPPTGNAGMFVRALMRDPTAALHVVAAFITRGFLKDTGFCRDVFFSKNFPEAEIERYMGAQKMNRIIVI